MTDTAAAPPIETSGSQPVPLQPGRRVAHGLGWALVWLGGLTLGFVVHQLWITTWLAELNQPGLDAARLAHFETATISNVEYEPVIIDVPTEPADEAEAVQPDGAAIDEPAEDGSALVPGPQLLLVESAPVPHEAFALIRIPRIERLADGWNVVEGVRRADLKTGAGHMPWTPLPGQPGNAVISGHRTTYGAPFHELDRLVAGDRIEVDTALGTHVYEVRETTVVASSDVWVTEPRPGAWLTLTTCHPRFSARQRLVVFAELVAGPNAAVVLGST